MTVPRDFQPLGDRPRKDGEQQGLRPLLLRRQKPVCPVARADEVLEEGERRDRRAEDVQREERHDDPRWNAVRGLREDAVNGGGEGDQREERPEPRDCLARPVEHERGEGREERPDRDGTRFHEASQAPLEQEREQEHEPDLARAIDAVALRPGQEGEPHQRCDLVDERNERREPEPERRIGPDPDAGEDRDQDRCEDERGLAQPLVRAVRRQRGDRSRTPNDPASPLARAHAHDSRRRPTCRPAEGCGRPDRVLSFGRDRSRQAEQLLDRLPREQLWRGVELAAVPLRAPRVCRSCGARWFAAVAPLSLTGALA